MRIVILGVIVGILVFCGVILLMQFQDSPSGANRITAYAIHNCVRMRQIAAAIEHFQVANGRLPADLGELQSSPYGDPLDLRGSEKELHFKYLGEGGRKVGALMYCLTGDMESGWGVNVAYIDFNLAVYCEGYQPWVAEFRRKVEDQNEVSYNRKSRTVGPR